MSLSLSDAKMTPVITETIDIEPPQIPTSTNNSYSFFKIGIILFILAMLGLNVFNYLGDITQFLSDTFGPFFKYVASLFGYTLTKSVRSVTNLAAEGSKSAIDVAAGTINTSLNVTEKITRPDISLEESIIQKEKTKLHQLNPVKPNQTPEPDDASSSIQKNQSSSKSGFCYIGEDRGFRSCIKVNEGDKCLSGDIFPTRDVCINPNLRV
jgi:hypothetical protein